MSASPGSVETMSQPLTALDRCDRCGAQAYLRTEPVPGMELLFCAHHAKAHADKLAGVVVLDETAKLAPTPAGTV